MSWDMWMTYWVYYVQNIWDNPAFWLNKRKAFCTKCAILNCLNIWFHIAIYTQYVTTGLINLIFAERTPWINSLALGKFEWNFKYVIFKRILVIDGWGIFCEIALIWMSLDFTDDRWRLIQVMAWCRQAPSHYLSQCWPRSPSPYDVTDPQWVKTYFNHVAILTLSFLSIISCDR